MVPGVEGRLCLDQSAFHVAYGVSFYNTYLRAKQFGSPMGYVPDLGFGRPDTFGQKEQSKDTAVGLKEKVKDLLS